MYQIQCVSIDPESIFRQKVKTVTSYEMANVDGETRQTEAINGNAAAASAATKTSVNKNGNDKSIVAFIVTIVKKVSIVGAIYLVGYMNWSIAWLITPMILIETHNYWHETNGINSKFIRKIARESALTNEKDVILANIKDFPSWVCIHL